ncbi:MAG TPA: alpha/beta hydrolase [Microbacterium sp.]|uniref:alpha/beta hydrolase n=1 Tax=Microbacterium sp. TaxID=51671 RepID=UPI002B6D5098|nr:alpha/beta hydrolase [Microbacterium sp.]HWI31593.1 alpha/beta hydrolase [Microbacterium sp.]
MSDDIEIRSGGIVAVDTETLRAVATRLDALAVDIEGAAERFQWAARADVDRTETEMHLQSLSPRADAAALECRDLATALRYTADVYEVVELTALENAAATSGDTAAEARYRAAIDAIEQRNPTAVWQGRIDTLWRGLTWASALTFQSVGATALLGRPEFASLGLLVGPLMGGLAVVGAGFVRSGSRLTGPPPAVEVRPIGQASGAGGGAAGAVAPPAGLAAAAARIPGGGQARVRVERYTMPDGTRQFAVYVAGTQTMAVGSKEPFDNQSNLQLYAGERSPSHEAVQQALRASGATAGDVVHAFGHSQGAMIAGRTAVEGEFDVRTLVSFGSPIEAEVPASTLNVSFRHVDDPVSALAGGGSPAGAGATGSFTVERLADPALGTHDLRMPAHGIAGYTDTAELVDASDDPRVDAVREVFRELEGAASVDVVEYAAERP